MPAVFAQGFWLDTPARSPLWLGQPPLGPLGQGQNMRFAMRRPIQLVLAVALVVGFAGAAPAQTVSDELAQTLSAQGFEVVSTRYTWLRRIVVTATNGEFSREILVARGAGIILDDKWKRLDTAAAAPRARKSGARSSDDNGDGLNALGGRKDGPPRPGGGHGLGPPPGRTPDPGPGGPGPGDKPPGDKR